jgi:hypothetical protein
MLRPLPHVQSGGRVVYSHHSECYCNTPAACTAEQLAANGAKSKWVGRPTVVNARARGDWRQAHLHSLTYLSWLVEATRPELDEAKDETRLSCAAMVMLRFSDMSHSSRDCTIQHRPTSKISQKRIEEIASCSCHVFVLNYCSIICINMYETLHGSKCS